MQNKLQQKRSLGTASNKLWVGEGLNLVVLSCSNPRRRFGCDSWAYKLFERRHDKTNNVAVQPAKTVQPGKSSGP